MAGPSACRIAERYWHRHHLYEEAWTWICFLLARLGGFLESQGYQVLILAGLPTSGSVARTAFAACDAEYVVTVISDACTDPQESVHTMMVENVLAARGWVTTSAAFQEGFARING